MKIFLQHISANANPIPHSVGILGSFIVYSAHNQILIHNPFTLRTVVSLNLNRNFLLIQERIFIQRCVIALMPLKTKRVI